MIEVRYYVTEPGQPEHEISRQEYHEADAAGRLVRVEYISEEEQQRELLRKFADWCTQDGTDAGHIRARLQQLLDGTPEGMSIAQFLDAQ